MSPAEYAQEMRVRLEKLTQLNTPLQLGAYSACAKASERIFTNGVNKEGQRFQYSPAYKKTREKRGFETSYVNWTFNADLKSDYENSPKGSNQSPTPVRINANEYQSRLVRTENQDKYKWLSEKYGDFLELNEAEIATFYDTVEKELTLIFTP